MFTARRLITAISVALWTLAVTLMFTPFAHISPQAEAFARVASVNAGALAACFTTVSVLPWLLREFYEQNITDYVGSFLAGWAVGQEAEPEEPARLTVVS